MVSVLRGLAGQLALLSASLLALWVIAGIFVVGRVVDEALFWIFDANTLSERLRVIGLCVAVLAVPLASAGVVWAVAASTRVLLWIPSRIARQHPLSEILAGIALAAFLVARGLALGLIVWPDLF